MSDIVDQVNQTQREVGTGRIPAGEGHTVLLRRHYAADPEDVWDACTDADRIGRWFLPITGDLRLGGHYQLQGNAGGTILRCEPPQLLTVTWVFGDDPTEEDVTEVEVRLTPAPEGGTLFELRHTAVVDELRWAQYGPGAVGVGWDLTVIGLHLHLSGQVIEDPAAWESSPEARELAAASSLAWGAAFQASGATAEEAAIAAENTTAFYAPDSDTTP